MSAHALAEDRKRIAVLESSNAALRRDLDALRRSYAELLNDLGPRAEPPVLDEYPGFDKQPTKKASRAAQLARLAGLEVRTKGGLRFAVPGEKEGNE